VADISPIIEKPGSRRNQKVVGMQLRDLGR